MYLVFKKFGDDWYQESPVANRNIHLRVGKSRFLDSIQDSAFPVVYLVLCAGESGTRLSLSPGTTDLWKLESENEWVTITLPESLKGIKEISVLGIEPQEYIGPWISEHIGSEVVWGGKSWKVCGKGSGGDLVILGGDSGNIKELVVTPKIECPSYVEVSLRNIEWEVWK